jgi:spoIIIJ-associated protein
MDFVEAEGDNIDAAIANALKALGVGREKITVDIISEGRKGILGFGAQKAKVRASLRNLNLEPDSAPAKLQAAQTRQAPARAAEPRARPPERRSAEPRRAEPPRAEPRARAPEPRPRASEPRPAPAPTPGPPAEPQAADAPPPMTPAEVAAMVAKAKTALAEILNLMGMNATVAEKAGVDSEETVLEVKSDNSGLIIGRKGQTLEALQYLVTRIAGERSGNEAPHVVIDIENYHERRRQTLQDMALRLGEKAKRQRKTVTIDALSAADRKVVHAALQDDPWLTTRSLGQGAYRRLLIIPEGDRKIKDEGPAPAQEREGGRAPRSNRPNPPLAAMDDSWSPTRQRGIQERSEGDTTEDTETTADKDDSEAKS